MVTIGQINVSVIGPGHLINGQPNQDFAIIKSVPTGWVAVVCDGMGSKLHSDLGSKLACRAVINVIKKSNFSIGSKDLIKSIYQQWLTSLDSVKAKDAITTCLICWLSHDGETRTFQLGDGLILTPNKEIDHFETNDFGNETTGLGKSTKFSDWEITHQQLNVGDVIALMTDGISEDISQGLEMEFANAISDRIKGKSIRRAKTWLKNEFKNWATPNHTDDKSLALLVINK